MCPCPDAISRAVVAASGGMPISCGDLMGECTHQPVCTHLCQHLGSMLARHGAEARNYPPELDFDEWIGQIRTASEGLLAYDPEDADRVAAARAALHWAADNLVDLWD